jgi:hypothetical protein
MRFCLGIAAHGWGDEASFYVCEQRVIQHGVVGRRDERIVAGVDTSLVSFFWGLTLVYTRHLT